MGRKVVGEELLKLTDQKESAYRELCLAQGGLFALSPGAVDLLTFLTGFGIPHTIATASERTNLDFFVSHLGLSRWFRIPDIVYDDGALAGKPAPDIYLRAAQNLGLEPAECIVVEDAHSGIHAARAAGMGHIIAIGPQSDHDKLREIEGVDEVVENLGQIGKRSCLLSRTKTTEPEAGANRREGRPPLAQLFVGKRRNDIRIRWQEIGKGFCPSKGMGNEAHRGAWLTGR